MAVDPRTEPRSADDAPEPETFRPYVPDEARIPEFTWPAVLLGTVLGILFGASSLYLVLKVGMTVSASIPVAVLSITLFRLFSRVLGLRRATILENNIVQTTGSAGESIAFGVGVTVPALMLLGHDMELVRIMTVGALGGLLGILMMIPLRRAFIVKQHDQLRYPEGTACADVLIVGEKGGATALTVFVGFGIAFLHKFLSKGMLLWSEAVNVPLSRAKQGLRGVLGGELSPELLGVGYIIGPRIASIMLAGGVLAYLVFAPLIILMKGELPVTISPDDSYLAAELKIADYVRKEYILYIGAGAVATGGIISMIQAMPLIVSSIFSGLRDLRGSSAAAPARAGTTSPDDDHLPRTSRDLPLLVVFVGAVGLVLALSFFKTLGLGFGAQGIAGSMLIVLFGFLFVTVSARLTGEIGSSSNPISGMTVATLLLTCLIFLTLGLTDKAATLTALTVAAVVCIAASNGGTTAQDLKTGYLVGATPWLQQVAILIGALSSALVIGVTLLLLNQAGTVYSRKPENLPNYQVPTEEVVGLAQLERPGGEYAGKDDQLYHVLNVHGRERPGLPQGRYLVDDTGRICYLVDPAINGRLATRDDGMAASKFEAPKTRLMALIIDGILNRSLPWELVLICALVALTLELTGTASLPFAVGVYLPIATSVPIFLGGAVRWLVDRLRRGRTEGDMSSGVLLSSGFIAGGSIAGMLLAFLAIAPDAVRKALEVGGHLPDRWRSLHGPDWLALVAFAGLIGLLMMAGYEKILRGKSSPDSSQS